GRAAGGLAAAGGGLGGGGAEDLQGLLVHAIVEGPAGLVAFRQLRAVAGVAAGPALGVLGEHPALDRSQVADEVAEGEGSRLIRPFQLLGRDAEDDAARPFVDALEVPEEGFDALDLHGLPMVVRESFGTARVSAPSKMPLKVPEKRLPELFWRFGDRTGYSGTFL